jgi:ubiquinol-cytochrome c reductase cytochrome b subunit
LYSWPWLEQRFITHDTRRHDLLDRPRDNPRRTAIGAAVFAWVAVVFFGGASDRLFLAVEIRYETQIWLFRGAFFLVPAVAYVVAGRIARWLQASEAHPLQPAPPGRLVRTPSGGWAPAGEEAEGPG